MKTRVQKAVSRGKVDVFITIDTSAADEAVVKLNRPLAQGYYKALCEINEACGLESEITASAIARFPDVLTVTKAEEDLECVAADLCAVLDDALAAYNRMRATEGERLAADIGSRLDTIEHITGMVEERSPQTVAEYRARLTAKMEEVLQSTTIDEARILTEAAIFADKIAVDEETVRLRSTFPNCVPCSSPTSRWAARWTSSFRRSTARAIPSVPSATTSPSRAMWSP